eukprot:359219-Chlamydomonas_euryale.AAC.14
MGAQRHNTKHQLGALQMPGLASQNCAQALAVHAGPVVCKRHWVGFMAHTQQTASHAEMLTISCALLMRLAMPAITLLGPIS